MYFLKQDFFGIREIAFLKKYEVHLKIAELAFFVRDALISLKVCMHLM